jgi:hypothetical protein
VRERDVVSFDTVVVPVLLQRTKVAAPACNVLTVS